MCTKSATYVGSVSCPAWSEVLTCRIAPYIPSIDPSDPSNTNNFDDTILNSSLRPVKAMIRDGKDTDTGQEEGNTVFESMDYSGGKASLRRNSLALPSGDSVNGSCRTQFKNRSSDTPDDEEAEEERAGPDEPFRKSWRLRKRSAFLPPPLHPAQRSRMFSKPMLPPGNISAGPAVAIDLSRRNEHPTPTGSTPVMHTPSIREVAGDGADQSEDLDIYHEAPWRERRGKLSNYQRNPRDRFSMPLPKYEHPDTIHTNDDVGVCNDKTDYNGGVDSKSHNRPRSLNTVSHT
jgi:hypothetical protein